MTSPAIPAAALSSAALSAALSSAALSAATHSGALSAATFAFAPSISVAEADAMRTRLGATGSWNARVELNVELFTSPCMAAAALSSACSPSLYSLCLRAART